MTLADWDAGWIYAVFMPHGVGPLAREPPHCHMVDLNVQLRLRLQAVQTLWPLDFGGVTA